MTQILITRHGEGEHNLQTDLFMGRAPDAPLTALGREQARRLGDRLAKEGPPARIICSSLPRTVETAQIIAQATGVDSVESDDAFWELSKGDWEGRMPRRLPPEVKREVDAAPFGYQYPGGESYRAVWERIGPAFDSWVARYRGERLLFVLHGDVIRSLLYHAIRFPTDRIGDWVTDPCGLSEFGLTEDGRLVIVRLNDSAHLSGD